MVPLDLVTATSDGGGKRAPLTAASRTSSPDIPICSPSQYHIDLNLVLEIVGKFTIFTQFSRVTNANQVSHTVCVFQNTASS